MAVEFSKNFDWISDRKSTLYEGIWLCVYQSKDHYLGDWGGWSFGILSNSDVTFFSLFFKSKVQHRTVTLLLCSRSRNHLRIGSIDTWATLPNYRTSSPLRMMETIFMQKLPMESSFGNSPVILKFIYSEKATKFCEISTNYLTGST